jgi:hypothetical protein
MSVIHDAWFAYLVATLSTKSGLNGARTVGPDPDDGVALRDRATKGSEGGAKHVKASQAGTEEDATRSRFDIEMSPTSSVGRFF